ncbi:MAG: hypothetical protein HQL84_05350 [Magnetococcales bacterium]|nr:hypothetical protein [Magnetococcales bacterium]MBF0149457.1 hypothetical protein [Magnetococcales bacterium]MBF0171880.1 hypothetical protein [Magnetococcales bacterium]MBF0346076.1 hypothetical protein [Magnetococcales bacterium]MBF0632281.1 hypothetical protein [Magnetococcales bacterium]
MLIKNQTDITKIWHQLNDANRDTLLKFAQFLLEQGKETQVAPPSQPLNIPPPPNENVVQALKRLKKNYPMIDADIPLLDAASQLILQKVLGGSDADLILKMERLFLDSYHAWLQKHS